MRLDMKLITTAVLFLTCTGFGFAQSDTQFAKEAAIGGMTEVQLGKLATKNASSEKVKSLGQMIADDHTKANDQLKSIAAKDNVTLPTDLDAEHRAIVDKFSKLTGSAFDQAYVSDLVKDHQEDIAKFQREAKGGSNPDLKNFASANLPTLQEHLRAAREAQKNMK
jgi:putative membrane protein